MKVSCLIDYRYEDLLGHQSYLCFASLFAHIDSIKQSFSYKW